MQVIAHYCDFTIHKTNSGLGCPKLEHMTMSKDFLCPLGVLWGSKTTRGRPFVYFVFQVTNCSSLVKMNFSVFLWSWRHRSSFLHGAKYLCPLLFMKFWLTSMHLRFFLALRSGYTFPCRRLLDSVSVVAEKLGRGFKNCVWRLFSFN
jgi:hypothetical protein